MVNMQISVHTGLIWFSKKCEMVCFDNFGVEYFPEEIKEFIRNKIIKSNIYRVQANISIMCGYFCTGFIDSMLAGKKLTNFTNLISPFDFEKNGSVILSYFKENECNSIESDKKKILDWSNKIQIKWNN